MVIDALAQQLFNKRFDRNGARRARARARAVLAQLAQSLLQAEAAAHGGREQFGREYAAKFLAACQRTAASPKMRWPRPRR
jgi:anhydro-N-acetylmuramic acid kinase